MVSRLRQTLQDAAWHGRNPRTGRWSQEDASELLLFLTETFDLPYLPFQTRLFHGASRDIDDDRVTTDRVLSLPIPPGSSRHIQLESILFDHFYDSIVTGVRRVVEPSSPTSMSSSPPTKKQAFLDDMEEDGIAVNAWQVLELLPFYSGMNEQGELIESQNRGSFPDSRMVLPIILKRYHYNARGSYVKDQRRVQVPASMQFNQFLNRNAGQPICDTCGQKVEGVMRLRSAVCHKGSTPTSGHYVAYACTKEGDTWLKLDDMAKGQRVTTIPDERVIFEELSKEGYLFFYELDKPCKHTRDDSQGTAAPGRRLSTDFDKAHHEPSLLEEVYHTIPASISSSNPSQKNHKKRRKGHCKVM
jgi:ribosomal protein L34E